MARITGRALNRLIHRNFLLNRYAERLEIDWAQDHLAQEETIDELREEVARQELRFHWPEFIFGGFLFLFLFFLATLGNVLPTWDDVRRAEERAANYERMYEWEHEDRANLDEEVGALKQRVADSAELFNLLGHLKDEQIARLQSENDWLKGQISEGNARENELSAKFERESDRAHKETLSALELLRSGLSVSQPVSRMPSLSTPPLWLGSFDSTAWSALGITEIRVWSTPNSVEPGIMTYVALDGSVRSLYWNSPNGVTMKDGSAIVFGSTYVIAGGVYGSSGYLERLELLAPGQ